MPRMRLFLIFITLSALAACSSQALYQTGQAWQKQECQKLQDRDERGRCEKSAATSFERYQAEAEAAKTPAEKPAKKPAQ
jgi:hypothetical protein